MEKLLHSLRNLDLAVPNGEQIVALIDADPRTEKQLAQQLAVPARIELNEEDAGSAVMDAALMSGATEAMLENYNTTLKKETDMLAREVENLKKPIKLKRVPLKALLAARVRPFGGVKLNEPLARQKMDAFIYPVKLWIRNTRIALSARCLSFLASIGMTCVHQSDSNISIC